MAISEDNLIKSDFIQDIDAFVKYLHLIKEQFAKFDQELKNEQEKFIFLEKEKDPIFKEFDNKFDRLWRYFNHVDNVLFEARKQYCEKTIVPYLYEGNEINKYIRRKPLGYGGDYVTMNYIYDFNDKKYLGETLFERLLNRYTCSIDVANSNIHRKEYLKKKIQEIIQETISPRILSVGCGPAREIIELLRENKITKQVDISLLDLEKNAIKYVEDQLKEIDYDRQQIRITLHLADLLEIVRSNKIAETFKDIDFIYASGVFDYLGDKTCKKIVQVLSEVVKKEMVVFNMSLENARHRAYYEVLGEWVMIHRKKEVVMEWASGWSGVSNIEDYPECRSYWILRLRK